MNLTVLERIARAIPDVPALAQALRTSAAEIDGYVAAGFKAEDEQLRQERAIHAALREEYRRRTGEVI